MNFLELLRLLFNYQIITIDKLITIDCLDINNILLFMIFSYFFYLVLIVLMIIIDAMISLFIYYCFILQHSPSHLKIYKCLQHVLNQYNDVPIADIKSNSNLNMFIDYLTCDDMINIYYTGLTINRGSNVVEIQIESLKFLHLLTK